MRCLWLAHRTELIWQANRSLQNVTSESVGHELPDLHSGNQRIVVASKDTIRQPRRLERLSNFRPFDVIVIDECHHAEAKSYRDVLAAFPAALRLGLSATPDRHDKAGLRCFDAATAPYRIMEAIQDGWLVPVKAKRVTVDAVDLSGVKIVAGDFAANELELVLTSEAALHGVAKGLLEHAGNRPTIVFAPGVDSARRLCEVICRYTQNATARCVTGITPADCRSMAFRDFGKTYQFLINVGVATEGTDLPAAACIAMFRPTKSRGLFTQMLGRGLRPLPGLCGASPLLRKAWISDSAKQDCLVLDFTGNTGRHSVVTVADISGADPRVVAKVAAKIKEEQLVDVFEAIQIEAAREEKAKALRRAKEEKQRLKREKIIASVRLTVSDACLIGLSHVDSRLPESDPSWAELVTPGQSDELIRLGIYPLVDGMAPTKGQARKMILDRRKKLALASPKQLDFVRRVRPDLYRDDLTSRQARNIFLTMKARWGK
jgi:superfamily II DNA or RNA helicase